VNNFQIWLQYTPARNMLEYADTCVERQYLLIFWNLLTCVNMHKYAPEPRIEGKVPEILCIVCVCMLFIYVCIYISILHFGTNTHMCLRGVKSSKADITFIYQLFYFFEIQTIVFSHLFGHCNMTFGRLYLGPHFCYKIRVEKDPLHPTLSLSLSFSL